MKEYKLKINGNDYNVTIDEVEDSKATVEVNGTPFTVEFDKPVTKKKPTVVINRPTPAAGAAPAVQVSKPAAPSTGGTKVNSPLPGVVLGLSVKEGEAVKKGQGILILEAMKMENTIEAPCDGTLKQFMVQKGDSVLEGALLAVIE
ncbi:MAG: biotin/lipoyl-binding protein [Bacteroidales bacterium]|nr:biotin/lipoyl-binding protein [Bacteroidales bacterium]MBR5056841.1 biotin/lipoyl-binding protein [Bacteroidales bacterium]